VLDEITETVKRHIVCDKDVARPVALWTIFTWLVDRVQVAPMVIITAPEKRCGKSQLLTLIGKLCSRPLSASNISAAAIFRVIDAYHPTLLMDEADASMKEDEEKGGIVNSGHMRDNAFVIRIVGEEHEPKQFSTWGAKALSGIGKLSDTWMDRSLILELRRKLPDESIVRLRHADPEHFERLKAKIARFAQDSGAAIESARPELPESLNDRAQDNWEPLLAIADHAGGDWPEKARKTAMRLSGSTDAQSLSTELLADIRDIFEEKFHGQKVVSTAALLEALTEDEEKPWHTFNRGSAMSPRQLAKRLEDYSIKPDTHRVSKHKTSRGYLRQDFDEVFARYLPPPDEGDVE